MTRSALAATSGAVSPIARRRRPRRVVGIDRLVCWMLALLVATQFGTSLTNREPIVIVGQVLPALSVYDGFSRALVALVQVLPFILGWRLLASARDHALMTRCLALAGFAYSFLALLEVRLSPQLNTWIYGFFQHQFAQHMRSDGFRPLVFLDHGLWLAIFLAATILAAAGMWRQERSEGRRGGEWLLLLVWLLATLVLSKSLGALALALALLPVVLFLTCRAQITAAAIAVTLVLSYPAVRAAGLIPVDTIEDVARIVSADRAASWRFRVDNEDRLLAHALEKPMFGWGGWDRNAVHDVRTGDNISVTDGFWIITLGISGWAGYLSTFGLLSLPILALWRQTRRMPAEPATAALAVILACNLLDMLPNASVAPVTWLMAGALTGLAARRPDTG